MKLCCPTTSLRSRNALNSSNSVSDSLDRKTFSGNRSFHLEPKLSRLSWKWRKRSSVKIAERTYEKRAQALHC